MAGNRRKPREGFRVQESRTLANFHKICDKTRNPPHSGEGSKDCQAETLAVMALQARLRLVLQCSPYMHRNSFGRYLGFGLT